MRRDRLYAFCALGAQVQRLLRVAPAESVHFIVFDDFKRDVEREFLEVTRFLGLPAVRLQDYPVLNQNKERRSKLLARLLRRTPRPLTMALDAFKRVTGIERLGLADALARRNRREVNREPLSEETEQELKQAFRDDIALLGSLIGRDLTVWTDPERTSAKT